MILASEKKKWKNIRVEFESNVFIELEGLKNVGKMKAEKELKLLRSCRGQRIAEWV